MPHLGICHLALEGGQWTPASPHVFCVLWGGLIRVRLPLYQVAAVGFSVLFRVLVAMASRAMASSWAQWLFRVEPYWYQLVKPVMGLVVPGWGWLMHLLGLLVQHLILMPFWGMTEMPNFGMPGKVPGCCCC